MKRCFRPAFLSAFFLFQFSGAVYADSLELQREQYQDAKKALRKGDLKAFTVLSEEVRGYPLYPYLIYNYLQPRIKTADNAEVIEFLKDYNDFPLANELRTGWLKHLARTNQWEAYFDNYVPQDDTVLQCNQLIARINTGNRTLLLEDIRSVWLSGSSLPPDCDAPFKILAQSELMTNELIWQRLELAMGKNNTGLASHLSKQLDGYYREWADKWIAVHNNPDSSTRDPHFEDTEIARQILRHGVQRLATQNLNKAIERWDGLQTNYQFTPGERGEIDRLLAIKAAKTGHPRAEELLDRVEPFHINDELFHWRLITALDNLDWEKLRKWTEGVPAHEDLKYRWFYWHARALEQTGDPDKAARIYTSIANKRDYYGFLAADQLGIGYSMEHKPLPDLPDEKAKIRSMPGIQRANELRVIGERQQARKEWNHALMQMTSFQKEIAARLAADWNWHDVAIVSLGSAHSYDDLEVRFPLPYENLISDNASRKNLDPGWVYALVRSESAFIEDAKSPAGALGLMQVMPQTGKETAKRMGLKNFQVAHLLEAEKNVPIGSAYLKMMLDSFDGNMILATAAYNAGPGRVKSWLPRNGCAEPDVWVEKIPFDETRTYVRRVMFFASIYDWRLRREVMPLQQRMATVTAPADATIAGLSCGGQTVSYN